MMKKKKEKKWKYKMMKQKIIPMMKEMLQQFLEDYQTIGLDTLNNMLNEKRKREKKKCKRKK